MQSIKTAYFSIKSNYENKFSGPAAGIVAGKQNFAKAACTENRRDVRNGLRMVQRAETAHGGQHCRRRAVLRRFGGLPFRAFGLLNKLREAEQVPPPARYMY